MRINRLRLLLTSIIALFLFCMIACDNSYKPYYYEEPQIDYNMVGNYLLDYVNYHDADGDHRFSSVYMDTSILIKLNNLGGFIYKKIYNNHKDIITFNGNWKAIDKKIILYPEEKDSYEYSYSYSQDRNYRLADDSIFYSFDGIYKDKPAKVTYIFKKINVPDYPAELFRKWQLESMAYRNELDYVSFEEDNFTYFTIAMDSIDNVVFTLSEILLVQDYAGSHFFKFTLDSNLKNYNPYRIEGEWGIADNKLIFSANNTIKVYNYKLIAPVTASEPYVLILSFRDKHENNMVVFRQKFIEKK